METLELAHKLVDVIVDRKGSNIVLLDIAEQTTFADYFLICNGENQRQLRALADHLRQAAKEEVAVPVYGIEGDVEAGWILLDLGALVVHLFSPEMRQYYELETVWPESRVVVRMQ